MTDITRIKDNFSLPAEWVEQDAIQLTWPHAETDWKPYLNEITETFLQMAKAITQHEYLLIAAQNKQFVEEQLKERLSQEEMAHIILVECPTNDTWARDHGAITLVDNEGNCKPLDFKFNGWGEKFAAEKDNAINLHFSQNNIFTMPLEDHNDLVLEGGSIESDGKGTIFTTECCLMAPHRNQPLTKEQIEEQLLSSLRADRVVWLQHGELIGDDTDGHIDTIVRTAPNDTLLYMKFDDANDPQYEDFMLLEEELKQLRTLDGKPYRLLTLPAPDAMYDEDDRLPATYANFVILNGLVIVPSYNQPEKDSLARDVVQQAFPEHKIISIDASTVVRQHGSLHCLTMQFPKNTLIRK